MNGLSSKSAGKLENKLKLTCKELQHLEFNDGTGLEEYDFGARFLDPQIGRWHSIDPLSESSRRWSPYNFVYDNPLKFIDPDGMQSQDSQNSDDAEAERRGISKTDYQILKSTESIVSTSEAKDQSTESFNNQVSDKDLSTSSKSEDGNKNKKQEKKSTTPSEILIAGITLTATTSEAPPVAGLIFAGALTAAGAKAVYDETQRTYVTYQLKGPGGKLYFGRASGFGSPEDIMMKRYSGHHMRFLGYGQPSLDRFAYGPSGYLAIRGREQMLIDAYGGIGSPIVGNAINAIWIYNPAKPIYIKSAELTFGAIIKQY